MTEELRAELLRCQPWIQAALDHNPADTHDFPDIVEGILSGRFQFWPAPEGCLITEVVEYPKARDVHVFLAGGKLDQILDMEGSLLEFARRIGAARITLAGRRGWKKVLKHWHEPLSVLALAVEPADAAEEKAA